MTSVDDFLGPDGCNAFVEGAPGLAHLCQVSLVGLKAQSHLWYSLTTLHEARCSEAACTDSIAIRQPLILQRDERKILKQKRPYGWLWSAVSHLRGVIWTISTAFSLGVQIPRTDFIFSPASSVFVV